MAATKLIRASYTRSRAMRAIPRTPVAVLLPGIVAPALWVAPACADVVTDWNVTANALVANDVGSQCITSV